MLCLVLKITWIQCKRHTTTNKMEFANLLPTVHCQAGTGNSKLEEENDEKNDHVLEANGQRNNSAKTWQI